MIHKVSKGITFNFFLFFIVILIKLAYIVTASFENLLWPRPGHTQSLTDTAHVVTLSLTGAADGGDFTVEPRGSTKI